MSLENSRLKFRAWYEGDEEMLYADNHWLAAQMFAQRHDEEFPIMQFTGLHDKNGKGIYEGDIVRCVNGHIGEIEWEAHDCCFNVTDYYRASDDYPTMAFMEGQPFEVVGNIYENPELLEAHT